MSFPVIQKDSESTSFLRQNKTEVSAVANFKVKWSAFNDWRYFRIWLLPNWTEGKLYQAIYEKLHKCHESNYCSMADVEEITIYNIKQI